MLIKYINVSRYFYIFINYKTKKYTTNQKIVYNKYDEKNEYQGDIYEI